MPSTSPYDPPSTNNRRIRRATASFVIGGSASRPSLQRRSSPVLDTQFQRPRPRLAPYRRGSPRTPSLPRPSGNPGPRRAAQIGVVSKLASRLPSHEFTTQPPLLLDQPGVLGPHPGQQLTLTVAHHHAIGTAHSRALAPTPSRRAAPTSASAGLGPGTDLQRRGASWLSQRPVRQNALAAASAAIDAVDDGWQTCTGRPRMSRSSVWRANASPSLATRST